MKKLIHKNIVKVIIILYSPIRPNLIAQINIDNYEIKWVIETTKSTKQFYTTILQNG